MECAPLSPGPLSRGERAEEKARRGARTMRARFPAHTDVRSENLRSPLANPEDMDVRRARIRGALSFGYFSLCTQRKVTRPQDGGRNPGRDAGDAVLGEDKSDSSFRWNDDQKRDSSLRWNDEQKKK